MVIERDVVRRGVVGGLNKVISGWKVSEKECSL
jgi:hypothetical protein